MKHTKDGKNLNALLRRAMLGVLDIMLFALANCSICYLTMSGHIMATDYKYMIFNYLHFGLTSVLLMGINPPSVCIAAYGTLPDRTRS